MLYMKINRQMTLRHIETIRRINSLDVAPYTRSPCDDCNLFVEDPSPESDFYFKITAIDTSSDPGNNYFDVDFKPYSAETLQNLTTRINESAFSGYYGQWVELVNLYSHHIQDSIQQSIIQGYEDDIYEDFELVDEDADTRSYSPPIQENIDDYLNSVIVKLEQFKQSHDLTDEVVREIDILLEDIHRLKDTQTRQTKRQVNSKLRNILARLRMISLSLVKEVGKEIGKGLLIDTAKDGIVNLVKHTLE